MVECEKCFSRQSKPFTVHNQGISLCDECRSNLRTHRSSDDTMHLTDTGRRHERKRTLSPIFDESLSTCEQPDTATTARKPKKLPRRMSVPSYLSRLSDSDDNDDKLYPASRRSRDTSGSFVLISKNMIKHKEIPTIFREIREGWEAQQQLGPPSQTSPPQRAPRIQIMDVHPTVLLPSIPKTSVENLWKSIYGVKDDPSVRRGVFAKIHVPAHRFLMEVAGEIIPKTDYKRAPDNRYSFLGTPRAHVFFYPSVNLCIDARHCGNDARFIRRSCHPNGQLKCISTAQYDSGEAIHLGLFTREEIDKGEEITIGWGWRQGHALWKKMALWKKRGSSSTRPPVDRYVDDELDQANADHLDDVPALLRYMADEFGDCACADKDDCFIHYLKRQVALSHKPKRSEFLSAAMRPDSSDQRKDLSGKSAFASHRRSFSTGKPQFSASTRLPSNSTRRPAKTASTTTHHRGSASHDHLYDLLFPEDKASQRHDKTVKRETIARSTSPSSLVNPRQPSPPLPCPSFSHTPVTAAPPSKPPITIQSSISSVSLGDSYDVHDATKPLSAHSTMALDKVIDTAKLPCKKAWLLHYKQRAPPCPTALIVASGTLSDGKLKSVSSMDTDEADATSSTSSRTSDLSATSTVSTSTSVNAPEPIYDTSHDSKPKVKLSLQEYLALHKSHVKSMP